MARSDVATQLRVARAARGWTQLQLQEATGISQADISRMEHGLSNPTVDTVDRLLGALGKSARARSGGGGGGRHSTPAHRGVLRPVRHSDEPRVPEWLIDGFLARAAVTMLAGAPGSGKSFLAQTLAAAAVNNSGGNVAGIRVEPGQVCIIDSENGQDLIQQRFSTMGLEETAWSTRLRIFQAEGFDLVSDLTQLDTQLSEDPCDILILDSWASLWSGSESSVDAVKHCLGGLRKLSRTHNLGILLIHHTTKGTTTYRGSGAIAGTIEAVFMLTRGESDRERLLACEKMRLGPEPPVRKLEVSEAGFQQRRRFDRPSIVDAP